MLTYDHSSQRLLLAKSHECENGGKMFVRPQYSIVFELITFNVFFFIFLLTLLLCPLLYIQFYEMFIKHKAFKKAIHKVFK